MVLAAGHRLLTMAKQVGADAIVAACPLCQSNIDAREGEIKGKFGDDFKTPVYFFTELMGLAFGLTPKELWLDKHLTDALPLLKAKGLA